MAQTVPIGEAAARKVSERLSALSLPEADYAALRNRQRSPVSAGLPAADEIRIDGLRRVNPEYAVGSWRRSPANPSTPGCWIATSSDSTGLEISNAWGIASSKRAADACWRSTPTRNPGVRTMFDSASRSPRISAATPATSSWCGIGEGLYAGFSLEAGEVRDPLLPGSPEGLLKSGSLFLALDSFFGPLYFAYGRTTEGFSSYYLFLGKP